MRVMCSNPIMKPHVHVGHAIEFQSLALPQNLWVDSDWFSGAFQGWHNLEVFAHAESRARNFFRHPLLRPMIFCI